MQARVSEGESLDYCANDTLRQTVALPGGSDIGHTLLYTGGAVATALHPHRKKEEVGTWL